jgi:hypothetical protein
MVVLAALVLLPSITINVKHHHQLPHPLSSPANAITLICLLRASSLCPRRLIATSLLSIAAALERHHHY